MPHPLRNVPPSVSPHHHPSVSPAKLCQEPSPSVLLRKPGAGASSEHPNQTRSVQAIKILVQHLP